MGLLPTASLWACVVLLLASDVLTEESKESELDSSELTWFMNRALDLDDRTFDLGLGDGHGSGNNPKGNYQPTVLLKPCTQCSDELLPYFKRIAESMDVFKRFLTRFGGSILRNIALSDIVGGGGGGHGGGGGGGHGGGGGGHGGGGGGHGGGGGGHGGGGGGHGGGGGGHGGGGGGHGGGGGGHGGGGGGNRG